MFFFAGEGRVVSGARDKNWPMRKKNLNRDRSLSTRDRKELGKVVKI